MKDPKFYKPLIEILKSRKIFDYTCYSYSIYHGDHETARDFLNHKTNRDMLNEYISYVDCSLTKINKNITNGGLPLVLKEYHPIVNSRIHLLNTDKANISNENFRL